jgi:hypothetical protein
MTPGQRIAVYCNPVSHAMDLAILGLSLGFMYYGGSSVALNSENPEQAFPGHHCVQTIKDKTRQGESDNSRAATPPESPPDGLTIKSGG